jgi:hypothetical protein
MRLFCRARGVKNSEENIHWNVVKGTFIGMSESHRGITSGAETATNVPFDSRNNRRTIRLATNTRPPLEGGGEGVGFSEDPRVPIKSEESKDPRVP